MAINPEDKSSPHLRQHRFRAVGTSHEPRSEYRRQHINVLHREISKLMKFDVDLL